MSKILSYILAAFVALATIAVLGLIIFFWYMGTHFTAGTNKDLRDPSCHTHEENRISFHLKDRALDLTRMIDSFKKINSKYKIPDYSLNETVNNCECCCINDDKEIFFDGPIKEIYWIKIARYNYNAGFEGQHIDDIGYIDMVSSFKNGNWSCKITSQLDSLEKHRIRKRIYSEIIVRLPIVKDTSSHGDEKW